MDTLIAIDPENDFIFCECCATEGCIVDGGKEHIGVTCDNCGRVLQADGSWK